MRARITGAVRLTNRTVIVLDCRHERAIGGHVWPDGAPVPRATELLGELYDCRDGDCGGGRNA